MPVHLSKLCFSIQAVHVARESWLIWAGKHPESSFRACGPYLHIFHHLVCCLSRHGDVCYWRVSPLIFQRPFHNLVGGLRSFGNDRTGIVPYYTFSLKDRLFANQKKMIPVGRGTSCDTASETPKIIFSCHFAHRLLSCLLKIHRVCMQVIILCSQDHNLCVQENWFSQDGESW